MHTFLSSAGVDKVFKAGHDDGGESLSHGECTGTIKTHMPVPFSAKKCQDFNECHHEIPDKSLQVLYIH